MKKRKVPPILKEKQHICAQPCTCSRDRQTQQTKSAFLFHLPAHPHPGVQYVKNSTKNALLAAKAMVSVAHNCSGETHQQDTEGWDTSALPSVL